MSYQPPSAAAASSASATPSTAAMSTQPSSSTESTVKSSMASTAATAAGTAENNKLNSYKNNNNHTEERNAVVLALFGPSVGRCIGDYATSYNRVNGRLYAATNAVLFYSNIFGFERRLMLELADVETIESYRSTSIKITTVDCEDYVFRKFANRDIVLTLLQKILHRHDNPQQQQQQQLKTGNNRNNHTSSVAALNVNVGVPIDRQIPMTKRGRSYDDISGGDNSNENSSLPRPHINSDVLPDISERREEDQSLSPVSSLTKAGVASKSYTQPSSPTNSTAETTAAAGTPPPPQAAAAQTSRRDNNNVNRPETLSSSSRVRSRSQPPPATKQSKKKLKKSPSSLMKRTKSALSSLKRKGSSVSSQISSDNSLLSSSSSSTGSAPGKFLLSSPPSGADRDNVDPKNLAIIQAAWKKASVPYEEILLETTTLSCTLDKFMALFLTDEAKFSIMRYQTEHIKDKNLRVSSWQKKKQEREDVGNNNNSNNKSTEGEDIINVLERKINFIHPLKNPVGPSEAKTARTQTFRRFHNFGMTLQNSTKIEGVPKADCFVVEDRWIFTKVSETQISFSVSFRMNFIKSTMFKSIIQKNTRSETKSWLRGYASYVQDVLSSGECIIEDETISRRKPTGVINQQTEIDSTSRMPKTVSSAEPAVDTTETTLFDKLYKVGMFVLLSTLVIQIFILRKAIASMESRLVETQTQNTELLAALIALKQQQQQ